MSHIYIEYDFTIKPLQPGNEILIAQLGLAGFESFIETQKGVKAYIQKKDWEKSQVETLQIFENPDFQIAYTHKEIAQTNWNQEWEKNFNPIEIDNTCVVRAPFHRSYDVPFEIIIEPKMSFGTGHHETTYMMLQFILEEDFNSKTVLDMGCGTAVLAILASKRGAKKIDAIDIDTWCYENSKENCERNSCKNISVYQGDVSLLTQIKYDIILANINRNILLQDIPFYASSLHSNGIIFYSGFYKKDLPSIKKVNRENGLSFCSFKEKNNWISAKFVKN